MGANMVLSTMRIRPSVASQKRTENIKRVVERLRKGELSRRELCAMLQFSPSGITKYIADLLACEIMTLVRCEQISGRAPSGLYKGDPVFVINPDGEHVDAYLDALMTVNLQLKADAVDEREKLRQVTTKEWKPAPVVHEPMLAHLFGLAKQEAT